MRLKTAGITFGIDGATILGPSLQRFTPPHKNMLWTTTCPHSRYSNKIPAFRRTRCRRARSRRSSGTLKWPILTITTTPLPSPASNNINIINNLNPSHLIIKALTRRAAQIRKKSKRSARRSPTDIASVWCSLSRNKKISMPSRCKQTTSSIQSLSKPTLKMIIMIKMVDRQRISLMACKVAARSNNPTLRSPTRSKSSIIRTLQADSIAHTYRPQITPQVLTVSDQTNSAIY